MLPSVLKMYDHYGWILDIPLQIQKKTFAFLDHRFFLGQLQKLLDKSIVVGIHVLRCICYRGDTIHFLRGFCPFALPETSMTPENRPSQKESNLPTIHFQ